MRATRGRVSEPAHRVPPQCPGRRALAAVEVAPEHSVGAIETRAISDGRLELGLVDTERLVNGRVRGIGFERQVEEILDVVVVTAEE